MGNEIQQRAVVTPTPQLTQSLSPEQRTEHRKRIAFDAEVLLHGYWQAFPPAEIKAAILADWADTLEDWTHEQVLYALRKWRNDFPDKRPNPGHILGMMKDLRGRKAAKEIAAQPAPAVKPPEPVDMERRRAFANDLISRRFPSNRTET